MDLVIFVMAMLMMIYDDNDLMVKVVMMRRMTVIQAQSLELHY